MKKILVNLKDWFGLEENKKFASEIKDLNITIFPAMPYIYLYNNIDGITLGAQDISQYTSGAHTGAISAVHLKELGIRYVILNHKELKVESIDELSKKIMNASIENINVIICVDGVDDNNLEFLTDLFAKVKKLRNISIGYEPIIEKNSSIVEEDIKKIRSIISKCTETSIPIYYGGNISTNNISSYKNIENLDGFIISRHALNIEELKTIINSVKE